MVSVTFLNNNSKGDLEQVGREALKNTLETLAFWQEHGTSAESHEYYGMTRRELLEEFWGDRDEVREVEKVLEEFENLGDFHEYGLSFDFVEATENHDGYFRYQMMSGGPSDEIRFYQDGTIEYVYLDWFCGVGFDISHDSTAEWLHDEFKDLGMLDFDNKSWEELSKEAWQYEGEDEEE